MIEKILEQGKALPFHSSFRSRLINGFYSYNHTLTVDAIRLKPNSAIYLDGISFSAGCKTWDFASAAVDGIGVQFNTRASREPVLLRQLRFYSFSDFMRLNALVMSNKPLNATTNLNRQDDYLTVGINGVLRQTEALLKDNKAYIDIFVSIAAYEITNTELINELSRRGQPKPNVQRDARIAEQQKAFQQVHTPAAETAARQNRPMPPKVKTQDMPPPLSLMQVRTLKSGPVGIEAWESP